MPSYDISGNYIYTVYDLYGDALSNAYDVNGNSLKPIPDITVMTYNPQGFGGINGNSTMLTELIQKYDPDIVGVQEAGWSNSWPTKAQPFISGFDYKHRSDYETGDLPLANPNGLLSKLPMASLEEIAYIDSGYTTYAYSKCYITVNGKTIAWYNTHLTWNSDSISQEERRLQNAQLLADAEQEDYVIATGDFNVWDHSYNTVDYVNVYKPWKDAGYKMVNFDTSAHCIATWGDSINPVSLADLTDGCDNIMVSPNIDIIDVWFDDTKLSYLDGSNYIDHIPVVATLKVN